MSGCHRARALPTISKCLHVFHNIIKIDFNVVVHCRFATAFSHWLDDRYNVNVLLYGQTGSGKSYTLSGTEADPGIIQRACDDLFKHLAIRPKVKVSASFIEIYNEQASE